MVEEAAQKGRLLAIGEAGLDYHYEHAPRHLQKEYLERYFTLAILTQLPIVIHCRDAFADLFDLADRCYRDRPLLLHCFTGTKEEAQRAIDRGWKLSFSGIVTFKNSAALREVVAQVSLESILLETDAPYLAPHSRRGLVNEPAFLRETALCIAQIKGSPIEEIIAATRENSLAFFRTTA
jgi:TatD DNase family protein